MFQPSPLTPHPSFTPHLWLGAYSPGALILPDAAPTPSQMYAPRGVYFDDERLIVADTGNHRLLIWHGFPTADGAAADVVLGQPDFYREGPNAGGRGPENGLHLPTGVLVVDGRLLVADAWNHRVLVWRTVPQRSDTPPDYALGQPDLSHVTENRGGRVSALGLYWPYGVGWVNGQLIVTDTGNRRVLLWHGLPEANQPPDLILGQDGPDRGLENRGIGVAGHTFRWPHAVAGTADMLYIADAGNHRILGWQQPVSDRCAEVLLGQADFAQAMEWPYGKQGAHVLRFPYAIARDGDTLACADTANNRVLFWHGLPTTADPIRRPADAVIGQPNFDDNGENRWQAVMRDTMCWPYGLWLRNGRLAIADSGNNRVMIWKGRDEG
ncbi:MAG: NHL repeat-containing protein [Anaerolineae bacterium]|nr:NHL repeat-containing protein [Anaerolineae bacterium]